MKRKYEPTTAVIANRPASRKRDCLISSMLITISKMAVMANLKLGLDFSIFKFDFILF